MFQKLNSSMQVQILSKQLVMQSCKGNFHLIWTYNEKKKFM